MGLDKASCRRPPAWATTMIYRILAANDNRAVCKLFSYPGCPDEDGLSYDPLRGAQRLLADEMAEIGLPVPRRRFWTPRARFWFTELGWKRFGTRLITLGKKWPGTIIHVISQKNPDRSRIVYEDEIQIALLPDRSKGGR